VFDHIAFSENEEYFIGTHFRNSSEETTLYIAHLENGLDGLFNEEAKSSRFKTFKIDKELAGVHVLSLFPDARIMIQSSDSINCSIHTCQQLFKDEAAADSTSELSFKGISTSNRIL
jgi:hypothetical protein